jgi:hypothetical protein
MRPSLFIGSSTGNLKIAYAAQQNLQQDAEVMVWEQGIFELSQFTLESLLEEAMHVSDFGLFVFAPDDTTRIHGAEVSTTRDNVVFELGLFIGSLGRKRCFIIQPEAGSDYRLPSDLLGITTARFQPPDRPARLRSALGPACHEIRTQIQTLGPLRRAIPEGESDGVDAILSNLSEYQREHLLNLAQGNTENYEGRSSLRAELRRLREMGFVRTLPDRSIDDMEDGVNFNLSDYVLLTDLGALLVARIE